MTNSLMIYLIFGAVILIALVFDLGLLSKKNKVITLKNALVQTIFWVALALAFGVFLWLTTGVEDALQYVSAYLLEWSLSIDNIFVFIIIFSFSFPIIIFIFIRSRIIILVPQHVNIHCQRQREIESENVN